MTDQNENYTDVSVIPATTGTFSSRADGTIVLKVEIEPYNKHKWLELLGTEAGVPIAIARIGNE